jgi:predicted ATPase/DNA-binding CsgD family transcriptional regulator
MIMLLPNYVTPLVGREQELMELTQLLLRADVRILTLTGTGGIGKTRLAFQVSLQLSEAFSAGVILVSLVSVLSSEQVLPTIALALGLRETGAEDLTQRLYAHLRERQLLLIVDNFEQVLPAAPLLSALAQACPLLKLLVTSRAVLHIQGEYEYALAPLALPTNSATNKELLTHFAAITLFIQRAQAVKKGFQVTSANAQTIATICRRLDGLPLALELAAARCKLLSPQALLDRLDRRFVLLTSDMQDVPAHQRTLRATLAWSYDLLSSQEQQLFRRLSIFVGGFTLEAASVLCAVEPGIPLEVLDGISSLLDKSLLMVVEVDDEPRFRMLEMIREYGLLCLEEHGELELMAQTHASYYLDLVQKAEPYLTRSEQRLWLERLGCEYDNLRASLLSFQTRQALLQALSFAGALWRFWWMRGQVSEGEQVLQRVLMASQDYEGIDPLVRARALNAAGTLAGLHGDMSRAEALCQESLHLFRVQGAHAEQINPLWMLGFVARERSLYDVANEFVGEALLLARQTGDISGMTYALEAQAAIALEQGEYVLSEARIAESLALSRQLGDTWEVARSLWLQALAALATGEPGRARLLLEESLVLSREVTDQRGIAYALVMLGYVAAFEGQPERMRSLVEESLVLHREAGDRRGTAEALLGLGWAHLLLRNATAAQAVFEECLSILSMLGRTWFLTLALEGLAMSLIALKQYERALRCWGAARELREQKNIALSPAISALYEPFLQQAHAQFSPAVFASLLVEGQALVNEAGLLPALFGTSDPFPAQTRVAPLTFVPMAYPAGLTAREVEVLRWVARGLTDNQVAEKLVISPRTVSTHLTSIYNKLGVSSRASATRFAVEQQLV